MREGTGERLRCTNYNYRVKFFERIVDEREVNIKATEIKRSSAASLVLPAL